MYKQFTQVVSLDVALKLKKAGYREKAHTFYNLSSQPVYDDFTEDWNARGNPRSILASAPTFAEALDWLLERRICIQTIPVYTFGLATRIAFSYVIYIEDQEKPKLSEAFKSDEYGSLPIMMNEAIPKALEMLKEKEEK